MVVFASWLGPHHTLSSACADTSALQTQQPSANILTTFWNDIAHLSCQGGVCTDMIIFSSF